LISLRIHFLDKQTKTNKTKNPPPLKDQLKLA